MHKIDSELARAIVAKKIFNKQNTIFRPMPFHEGNEWELILHGHTIATFDTNSKYYPIPKYVSLAGYPTHTTCARLNALSGVNIHIKNGTPYLNGREIEADGWWSPCNLSY